ncbi:MAG: hypothetical protein AB1345_01805 [Chloroflexota bacterium]
MFRRPIFRPPPPDPRRGPQRLIRRAHHLMQQGRFGEAGDIFEQLARGAEERGIPRAAQLYLQAAQARFKEGNGQTGYKLLRHGLELLANAQRWPLLLQAGRRSLETLRELNHPQMATEIENWLKATLPERVEELQPSGAKPKTLPPKCPFCGGNVRPDEVEWMDTTTAECMYCGSPIQAAE